MWSLAPLPYFPPIDRPLTLGSTPRPAPGPRPPLCRCREVCLDQLERGNYQDEGAAVGALPINYRQLANDLELLQV